MATFFFEIILDEQAETFNPETDLLVFGAVGERANRTTVRYNPPTADRTPTITIVSGLTGKELTLPASIRLENVIFPDNSQLYVGEPEPVTASRHFGQPPGPSEDRIFEDQGVNWTTERTASHESPSICSVNLVAGNDVLGFGEQGPQVWLQERERFPRPPRVLGLRGHVAGRQSRRRVGG